MTDEHAAEEPRRDGAVISDEMLANRDAVVAGTMSKADYKAACARNHAELDELFAESRQQQDAAMQRYQADREAEAGG